MPRVTLLWASLFITTNNICSGTFYSNLFVPFSGITTLGLKVAASSGVIVAYAIIMATSPGLNL